MTLGPVPVAQFQIAAADLLVDVGLVLPVRPARLRNRGTGTAQSVIGGVYRRPARSFFPNARASHRHPEVYDRPHSGTGARIAVPGRRGELDRIAVLSGVPGLKI